MLDKLFSRSMIHSVRKRLFPYKKLGDDFYETLRLTCSGATLFVPENLYCIDYAVSHLPTSDPVLEIGSFLGMSTNMMIHYLRKHQRQNIFFTCDRWEFEEKERNYYTQVLEIPPQEMKQFIKDSFIRNLRFFNRDRLPYTIELFSDEFFAGWKDGSEKTDVFGRKIKAGGPISFAYVDGNHQLEFVRRDFENIHRYLVEGGFIFFDDSAPYIKSGVRLFMKEMKKRNDYETVMKNPNYLFRKVK